jgi:hypothetical protein
LSGTLICATFCIDTPIVRTIGIVIAIEYKRCLSKIFVHHRHRVWLELGNESTLFVLEGIVELNGTRRQIAFAERECFDFVWDGSDVAVFIF